MPPAERAFILGVLAGKRGDSSAAVRYFSRLDSLPHRVVGADQGWGLRALSLPLRALELDKLGRFDEAAEFRDLFLSAWSDPDPLNEGFRAAVLEAAQRTSVH